MLKFNSNSNEEEKISTKINNVVSNNLQRSGLFKVLPEETFLEKNIKFNETPTFSNWKLTTSQGLVHGRLLFKRNQTLVLEFRLWDVFSEKQMVAQQLTTEISNWRRIAHVISDIIYKRITGETGYFDSRIVYISESGPKSNRKKEISNC